MVIASEVERRKVVFGIPDSPAGRVVAELPLAWAWVDDGFQAIVNCKEFRYPNCVLATAEEIASMM